MNAERLYRCPVCRKPKPATHFACAAGAKGGASVNGIKKIRGDGRYYAYLGRKRHKPKES